MDLPDGTSLFDRVELKSALEDLLLTRVDLIRRRNLKPGLRATVEAEAPVADDRYPERPCQCEAALVGNHVHDHLKQMQGNLADIKSLKDCWWKTRPLPLLSVE